MKNNKIQHRFLPPTNLNAHFSYSLSTLRRTNVRVIRISLQVRLIISAVIKMNAPESIINFQKVFPVTLKIEYHCTIKFVKKIYR